MQPDEAINSFISNAPDGASVGKKIIKGKRQQITATFDPDVIEQLDALSDREGVSRAALIRLAVKQLIMRGTTVGG